MSNNQRFDSVNEFNSALGEGLANAKSDHSRDITGAELDAIRARVAELRVRWAAVPQGGRLELAYEPPAVTA